MFEELNQHRAAVAENIQKAVEIGFTGSELEKAHKVGDIHPNGKWVWTQLPSGRQDWRVIKRGNGGSSVASPATAQKPAQSREDLISKVPGLKNLKEYLTTFNSKYTDFDKVSLSKTPKGNWEVRYDGHRLGIMGGDQISESVVKTMELHLSKEEKEKMREDSFAREKEKREKLAKELDKKEASKLPKIKLTEKDFHKSPAEIDEYNKNAPLRLNDYTAEPLYYYTDDGKKMKSEPFISEFYSSARQNAVGGYEAYFDKPDSIGTFRTLKEAVSALEDWINKVRVKGHAKPKWIYNANKGDYQMKYQLD